MLAWFSLFLSQIHPKCSSKYVSPLFIQIYQVISNILSFLPPFLHSFLLETSVQCLSVLPWLVPTSLATQHHLGISPVTITPEIPFPFLLCQNPCYLDLLFSSFLVYSSSGEDASSCSWEKVNLWQFFFWDIAWFETAWVISSLPGYRITGWS